MVKIMLAKTIDREIIPHTLNDHSDDRLLATFHTARVKKTATWKCMGGAKKNNFKIEGQKETNFLLISEMEGRRIRNPKYIISEALDTMKIKHAGGLDL
jgi:hypothetical protein